MNEPSPGLAELRRPLAPVASATSLSEALPSLDPALEQRIRSIFRDTALGSGEPHAGEDAALGRPAVSPKDKI